MSYKLSNIASKERIKDFTKLNFKYPHLHKPRRKINGLKEQTVNIITMDNPLEITQGIWGMLPQNYADNWNKFQQIKRTLHVRREEIKKSILFKEALLFRRCLLIVTGFYAHKVIDGSIENYLVEKDKREPFYLAGVYNTTEDGFVTCSVINTNTTEELNSFNNLYEIMPLQIPRTFKKMWLDRSTDMSDVEYLINNPYDAKYNIQKIIT
ncbi:SOS response-associated peptidase family protein [uncultured Tenacibaculum sp.]|uniref:SOS response-associated peptidase family protein n=1 Tax=uncultured Tenacibaculum sp. TaxID=174713 RepID=UPI00260B8C0F|nr:SOS response-associated peptidase family protein [uncultured Tenacibaculum sp.]